MNFIILNRFFHLFVSGTSVLDQEANQSAVFSSWLDGVLDKELRLHCLPTYLMLKWIRRALGSLIRNRFNES